MDSKIEKNQHYHDKVEFEIVIGEYCFDFDNRVKRTIPNILSERELENFRDSCSLMTKIFSMEILVVLIVN